MDRGAWWATVHGVARVRHDLATKPSPPMAHMQPGTSGLPHEQVLLYSFLHNLFLYTFMYTVK